MNLPFELGRVHCGDALEALRQLPAGCVDAVVTDPPYELGFMGKGWDSTGIAYNVGLWREALRVAKPGAHLLAFGAPRTAHRLACAIEDAGWGLRDCIAWVFGSGFPKSLDVSKAIDKAAGAERNVVGVSAAQPAGFVRHGRTDEEIFMGTDGNRTPAFLTAPATAPARRWKGWGTALKPAYEPCYLARKPLAGTVAANVLKHATGAINIDGCRVGTEKRHNPSCLNVGGTAAAVLTAGRETAGRWPANLILSVPEDEYELRDDVTPDQLRALAEWMNANPE